MRIIVLDTETLGVADPQVYDLGYLIYDDVDGIIVQRDYIAREIYDDQPRMETAYYYNKLPIYEKRLADGYCKKCRWADICRILKRDINKYKPDGIYAYNSRFDTRSIATTCESLGVKKNPTADGILDIWKGMTDPHITKSPEYIDFCRRNGFMTKHKTPRPQAKAETVFRFLTGQTDYVEEHTALEDSKIELAILLKVFALTGATAQTERGIMKYYCPIEKGDAVALELARDEMFGYLDWVIDEGYAADGVKVSLSIKKVGTRYEIEIKQGDGSLPFFVV